MVSFSWLLLSFTFTFLNPALYNGSAGKRKCVYIFVKWITQSPPPGNEDVSARQPLRSDKLAYGKEFFSRRAKHYLEGNVYAILKETVMAFLLIVYIYPRVQLRITFLFWDRF